VGSQSQLMALSAETMRQATMIGYLNSFYLFAVTALVGLPLALWVRWRP